MDAGLALEGVLFKYNTKFDSNGSNILLGAFDSCDGKVVPLSHRFYWNKQIGYVFLSVHDNGIYFTAFIKKSEDGKKEIEILKGGNMKLAFFAKHIKYDDYNKNRKDRMIVSGDIAECSIIEKTETTIPSEIYTVDGMKYNEWCKMQHPKI